MSLKMDFAIAVKAVIIKEEKYLLLHRSKREIENSFINRREPWDLPGGGVRFFESSERALFREIKEETQLKVRPCKVINVYDVIKTNLHMIILTYACEYVEGEVVLSDEHDAFYWMDIEEMESREVPKWMIRMIKTYSENNL